MPCAAATDGAARGLQYIGWATGRAWIVPRAEQAKLATLRYFGPENMAKGIFVHRVWQLLLMASMLAGSWLGMMAVHELGHVLNAWLSGGRVTKVDLALIGFSQTHVLPNPHPQFTAWGGALWSTLLPLALWAVTSRCAKAYTFLAAFFAGLCLIANGVYLAAGSFIGAATDADDAHELMRHGASRWQLVAFGVVAATVGLRLWHGLGPCFGIGNRGVVDRRAAIAAMCALICVFALFLFAPY